jgi:nitroimidazol reductase NimA-like FMN-containing flavoprotein (pyridoxamine 5'-phosphate oxidase superfamily)
MTLATADADGVPWASPVWYATEDGRHFYWVSDPDARHSRNIAQRPEIAIVIFDSTVTPDNADAVYFAARAEMAEPDASRTLDLLAALSHHAQFSVGCYCSDEAQCHRSVLRALLQERGAKVE